MCPSCQGTSTWEFCLCEQKPTLVVIPGCIIILNEMQITFVDDSNAFLSWIDKIISELNLFVYNVPIINIDNKYNAKFNLCFKINARFKCSLWKPIESKMCERIGTMLKRIRHNPCRLFYNLETICGLGRFLQVLWNCHRDWLIKIVIQQGNLDIKLMCI